MTETPSQDGPKVREHDKPVKDRTAGCVART